MEKEPLVSVLMTAFNREMFIDEAITSVLQSTYSNFELIIVDDCSSDATFDIAKRYEQSDSRVKVFKNERNLGDYPNRNKAAGYANGQYLKYVDSDDKLFPKGLAYCVNQMKLFPQAHWGSMYAHAIENEFVLGSEQAIRWHFFKEPFLKIGPGGTIIDRQFFFAIGGYPIDYGPANDMFFNLKAASRGTTLLLNDCFLFYRIHAGQEQNNHFSYLYNNYRYLRDALSTLEMPITKNEFRWIDLKLKRRFAVNLIHDFLKKKDIKRTQTAIQKADFSFRDFLTGIFHSVSRPL